MRAVRASGWVMLTLAGFGAGCAPVPGVGPRGPSGGSAGAAAHARWGAFGGRPPSRSASGSSDGGQGGLPASLGRTTLALAQVGSATAGESEGGTRLDVGPTTVPEPSPLGDDEVRSGVNPRCPPEMSLLPSGSCIDRWEASLVRVDDDGSENPWSPFAPPKRGGLRVRAVSQPGVIPQAYISGVQAEEACQASGKRLCTAREWESACRGPRRTVFPYGDQRRAQTCNDDGRPTHPVADVTVLYQLPGDQLWRKNMVHPMINQLPNTLLPTGDRSECTNDFGVFDMVGNLHEWIADPDGTFRGGFYMDTKKNGEGCLYATTAHVKQYHDYSTGFRCCSDASSD